MTVENLELWIAVAALWTTQLKLMLDVREIKGVIVIKKKADFKQ